MFFSIQRAAFTVTEYQCQSFGTFHNSLNFLQCFIFSSKTIVNSAVASSQDLETWDMGLLLENSHIAEHCTSCVST